MGNILVVYSATGTSNDAGKMICIHGEKLGFFYSFLIWFLQTAIETPDAIFGGRCSPSYVRTSICTPKWLLVSRKTL